MRDRTSSTSPGIADVPPAPSKPAYESAPTTSRRRLELYGQVQGVGLRPSVYRLARELSLAGCVANNTAGAIIEIEGSAERLDEFERRLPDRLPPLARVTQIVRRELRPCGQSDFHIARSEQADQVRPDVTPDAATCPDCLRELFDPADRRFHYAFTNCTNCGPRYSIIRSTPYDRPFTTMSVFRMCPDCKREYDEPADRRFHAQPNACPVCGPALRLIRPDGTELPGDPVVTAADLLREGRILAVKGIGGYHLACRADSDDVVTRLRRRKLRDGKPLAIMVRSLEAAERICRLTPADRQALLSPAAPIVLADKRPDHGLASSVAPGCRDFGLMLPYSPLHHLLLAEGLPPLVLTSANEAHHPLTFRDDDALEHLCDAADALLTHNREIFRPIDDSVVFTFHGDAVPIRRARGYAPQPLMLPDPAEERKLSRAVLSPVVRANVPRVLAVGGELKSTACLLDGNRATLTEHCGDLTNPAAYRHYMQAVSRLSELLHFEPQLVAHDLHPAYLSTHFAHGLKLPRTAVQHHHAHAVSAMAEWGERGPAIGVICDGTGYGTDGATWGCEILWCERGEFQRLGHLDYFPLVGGDAAARHTWRPAAALLHQSFGPAWRDVLASEPFRSMVPGSHPLAEAPAEHAARFDRQIAAGINVCPTSSLGRVFDAVSFLLGLCQENRHEAEAAMALEAEAEVSGPPYPLDVASAHGKVRFSFGPCLAAIVADRRRGRPTGEIAARFHETVACTLATAAELARAIADVRCVALSGGCFANRRLLGRLVELLEGAGTRVIYHRRVPSGDGGLSLGQAVAAAWRWRDGEGIEAPEVATCV
jgi:hydrogenase maturation protein HypF